MRTGRRAWLAVAVAGALLQAAGAHAWKPTTHLYLAEQALDEIRGGQITIDLLDPRGVPTRTLGPYRVDPALARSLTHTHRSLYLAGVVGPDAFPDIMTGQMVIHPAVAAPLGGSERGTDAFLSHLWRAARSASSNRHSKRAFVLGYLTHAAGDAFAHSFINFYADGSFHFGPNAARHIVMESYIGKRAPHHRTEPSVPGSVLNFVHDNLVRARPGSDLKRRLLRVPSGADPQDQVLLGSVVPRYYSRLRNKLQAEIERYDALPALHIERADLGLLQNYRKAWRANIDRGLREWVKTSRTIADKILWSTDEDFDGAKAELERFGRLYGMAMNGAPKELGFAAQAVATAQQQILQALGVPALQAAAEQLVRGSLDRLLRQALGVSLLDFERYVTNPGQAFDGLFAQGPRPITRARFNTEVLGLPAAGLSGPTWDWHELAPAYNTVTITKLLFLDRAELNRFLDDLTRQVDAREVRRQERIETRRRRLLQLRRSRSRVGPASGLASQARRGPRTSKPGKGGSAASRKGHPLQPSLGVRRRGVEEPQAQQAEDDVWSEADEAALVAEVDRELREEGFFDAQPVLERGVESSDPPPEFAPQDDPWDDDVTVAPEDPDEERLPGEDEIDAIAAETPVATRSVAPRSPFAPTLQKENLMLGFLQSIDSSNGWAASHSPANRPNGSCKASGSDRRMVLATSREHFFAVFKDHAGIQKSCLPRLPR